MSKLAKLGKSSHEILDRIVLIEVIRRGSVARQFFKSKAKGALEGTLVGPYALSTYPTEIQK